MSSVKPALEQVFAILDVVLVGDSIPPGAKGQVHALIDSMRLDGNCEDQVKCAEKISLSLHLLDLGLRNENPKVVETAREELRTQAAQFLHSRIADR